jgi:hypothetical protein
LVPRINSSSPPGYADVFSGADTEGTFGRLAQLATTDSSSTSGAFGRSMLTGAIPGTTAAMSYIGDSRADLAVTTKITTPRLYLVDGSKVTSLLVAPGNYNVQSVADVTYALPGTWADFSRSVISPHDLDGDGYGDIAVGEASYSAAVDGKVLVLR